WDIVALLEFEYANAQDIAIDGWHPVLAPMLGVLGHGFVDFRDPFGNTEHHALSKRVDGTAFGIKMRFEMRQAGLWGQRVVEIQLEENLEGVFSGFSARSFHTLYCGNFRHISPTSPRTF